jgi:surface protein
VYGDQVVFVTSATSGGGTTTITVDNSLTPAEKLDECALFVIGNTVRSGSFVYAGQAPEDRWDAASIAGQTALSLSDRANADLSRVDSIMRFLHDIPLANTSIVSENNDPEGQPVIVGTPEPGEILTADISGITDADGIQPGSYGYQWLQDGIALSGQDADQLNVDFTHLGGDIAVIVTYVDNNGVTEATQSETVTIITTATPMILTVNDSNIQINMGRDNALGARIDWGDGTTSIVTPSTGSYSSYDLYFHTYTDGLPTHNIEILADATHFRFGASSVTDVTDWGSVTLVDATAMFGFSDIVTFTASNTPNFGTDCSASEMFYDASLFTGVGSNIGAWDTSNIVDMSYMFYDAPLFNEDIGGWDVSNVVTMAYMFGSTS